MSLCPATEGELAEAIRSARGPLSLRGGDTRGMAPAGAELSLSALSGIVDYEPGGLTLVVRSGTALDDITASLEAENQMLAFEPMDHRPLLGTTGAPTIGGVIGGNVSGPRRLQVGAVRDVVLGVRFVDGTGTIISNGGRVMKNVTGYDLGKLLTGSRGALGALSQVSLKVLPKPETAMTLHLPGLAMLSAFDAMTQAVNSPFGVSGAAQTASGVFLRLEGMEASVRYRAGQLTERLRAFGEIDAIWAEAEHAQIWRDIRDVMPLAGHDYVWRVAMTPSSLYRGLLAGGEPEVRRDVLVDWAGGLAWIGLTADQARHAADMFEGSADQARFDTTPEGGAAGFHLYLQDAAADRREDGGLGGGGHAALVKAPAGFVAPGTRRQPLASGIARIEAGLRQQFDPRGLFSAEAA